jgi:hypothetical protein
MRLHNLIPEQTIVEVPMNPSHFAAAIDTGQERGVLVGFEFEVCIPEEFVHGPKAEKETDEPMTVREFIDHLKEADFLSEKNLDEFTPYSYTDLMDDITEIEKLKLDYVSRNILCRTLAGNRCDYLTITSRSNPNP